MFLPPHLPKINKISVFRGLADNRLPHLPLALTQLPALRELSVSGNRIKYIPAGVLQRSPELALLELRDNPLVGVDPHAFSFLPRLRKLWVISFYCSENQPDICPNVLHF